MLRRRLRLAFALIAVTVGGAALANGCSAAPSTSATGSGGANGGGGGAGGGTTTTTTTTSGGGSGGEGGIFNPTSGVGGSGGAGGGVQMNPCGSKCGPKELCDVDHVGLDDNCDGQVDEDCPCSAGSAHFCFKGDPSFHGVPGCFDGTQKCSENGTWGPCQGGVHATPEQECYTNDTTACHAITATPFADVNLKSGTGNFSGNAVPGSESWQVTCPQGVDPCPAVTGMNPADDFKPLQSGEYTVKYTKGLPGGGTDSCTYPLFVGAPGLRVELQWEHTGADSGVDLDLHVHKPKDTQPWSFDTGKPNDCTWANCTVEDFTPPQGAAAPKWFADAPPAMPPTPVNWWLYPVTENNTCYYAPRGVGQEWKALGLGCHNPRLDLDNVDCDFTQSDPNDPDFCAPENINIDFPPADEWIRVGVHYYSNNSLDYDVHPTVKIFCDGALAAELGPSGYYAPEFPVTFSPADGEGDTKRFWVVADVAFKKDQCQSGCVVKPVYSDPKLKTPYLTVDLAAGNAFAPAYPPLP